MLIAFKRLLEAGARINDTSDDGSTALLYAAKAGYPGVVSILIHAGAKANALSSKGTPLDAAIASNKADVIQILKAARGKESSQLSGVEKEREAKKMTKESQPLLGQRD